MADCWYYYSLRITYSELLHACKGIWLGHALNDLVAVLDVFVEVFYPRVENVAKTVLSQVFHRYYAQSLGEWSLHPHLPQLQYGVEVCFKPIHLPLKLPHAQPQVPQHFLHIVLVPLYEIYHCLTVIFWDIFGLAYLAVPLLLRIIALRLVRRLLLVVTNFFKLIFVDAALFSRELMTVDHSMIFQSLEVYLRVPTA